MKVSLPTAGSMDTSSESKRWPVQAVAALLAGALEWAILVAIPGTGSESGQVGSAYVPVLVLTAVVLGAVFGRDHLLTACLLAAPALVSAPITAPRGDGDGLWVLWFPAIIFAGFLAAAAHWFGHFLWQKLHRTL
jgi:hypothetical protein